MTERAPLVLFGGQPKRLPPGDTVLPITYIDGLAPYSDGTDIHSGTGTAVLPDGTQLTVSSDLTITPGTLAVEKSYYLYLYDSGGGTAAIELVIDVPTVYRGTARQKTGNAGYRLLDAFVTGSDGVVLAQHRRGASVHYDVATYITPKRILSGGQSTSETTLSCTPAAPTWSDVILHGQNTDTARYAIIYANDSVSRASFGKGQKGIMGTFSTDGGGNISYAMSGTASGGLTIDIMGWMAER